MGSTDYIGHEWQLQQLEELLEPRSRAPEAPGLILITGPSGIGKRAILERSWAHVSGGDTPRAFLKFGSGDHSVTDLANTPRCNRSYLTLAFENIQKGLQAQVDHLQEAGRPLPPEAQLSVWADLFAEHVIDEPRNNRELQLLIEVSDVQALTRTQLEQIAQHLPLSTPQIDLRLLFTSSTGSSAGILSQLFTELLPLEEIALPTLELDQVERWIHQKGVSPDLAMPVFHRSGGLPGKLESALEQVRNEEEAAQQLAIADTVLEPLSVHERHLLCTAAMLPEISAESLRSYMDEAEALRSAQELRNLSIPESAWQGGVLHLSQRTRDSLRKWLEKNEPEAYRKAQIPAAQFGQIAQQMPSAQQRRCLARLSGFHYFNPGLIKEVTGAEADELVRFIELNPNFFESSGYNLRLRQDLNSLVEQYCKIVRYSPPAGEVRQIAEAWNRKRQEIMDQMAKAEGKVNKDGELLTALQSQIKHLDTQIRNETDQMQKYRSKATKAQAKAVARRNNTASGNLFLQIVGTGIIFVSIIITSRFSLLYAAIGVILIAAGLFMQERKLVPQRAGGGIGNEPDLSQFERNLHFLGLKRSQLDNRKNVIAASIAREKSALKEFDKQLREPYS